MEPWLFILGWIGIFAPIALGAVGSMVGCSRAGQAACGAMLETESGYGRYVGLSAMPSSQTIYGIVVTLILSRPLTLQNAPGIFAIGMLVGIALLASGYTQGDALAAAISASKNKTEIFGLSIAPAAIIEGFAVFAFVFALVLVGSLPAGE